MSDILEKIILGVVQGLTEFLPVSSSGHIEIAQWIMQDESLGSKEESLLSVILHAATALATIVVFRKDILDILKGLLQFKWNEDLRYSLKIVLSMIPAAIVGIALESEIEDLFDNQILLVGLMLLITGALLLLADKAKKTGLKVSFPNAFIIGIAQMIAILPGISRSGATISTSVLLGIDRERSARFSFLMVVPLILGKMAKDLLSGDLSVEAGSFPALAAGFVAAFVTGILACVLMIRLVKKAKLSVFAIYCFLVGVIVIGVKYYQDFI